MDEVDILFKDPDGDDVYDVRYLYKFLYEKGDDYPYEDPKHPKYPYTGKEISNDDLQLIKTLGKSMIYKYPIDIDDDGGDDTDPNTQMMIEEGKRNHERNIDTMRLRVKANTSNTNTGDMSDTNLHEEKMRADCMRRIIEEEDIDLSDISD